MARETGLSKSSVQRLWSAHAIAPHRLKSFKLSKDLAFEEKFWDVVGLYLNPPDRALLLCCDEKSQCQALERSQPGLPLSQGHIRTQTHDYYRHGTVTLFAALDYLSGKVFAHTAQYDGAIANHLSAIRPDGSRSEWPQTLTLQFRQSRHRLIRYNRNQIQSLGFIQPGRPAPSRHRIALSIGQRRKCNLFCKHPLRKR